LYWWKSIVPNLYAALAFFKSISLNRMLDQNPLLKGSFMGSQCIFNVATSKRWYMHEPSLAKANVGEILKEKGRGHSQQP
jgi:hypothetical protein